MGASHGEDLFVQFVYEYKQNIIFTVYIVSYVLYYRLHPPFMDQIEGSIYTPMPIAAIISSPFHGLSLPSLLPRAGDQSSLGEQHRVALNLVPPVVKALALFPSRG